MYKTVHMDRTMKVYPILESEMRSLGVYNLHAKIWLALSSALAALSASCFWDMVNAGNVSFAAKSIAAIFAVGTLVSGFLGGFYVYQGASYLKHITTNNDRSY